MIPQEILASVRNGTCAVGYLTVPLEVYKSNPTSPFFKVLGTGFLVRDTTAMTNRHVVEGLLEEQANFGFPDRQRMLMFVAGAQGGLRVVVRMIRGLAASSDPAIDVALVHFEREPVAHFQDIEPLHVQDGWTGRVSEDVAVCGYPYGHYMLQRDGRVYRWGPVVQQGHLSGVSPFDTNTTSQLPDEVLLDLRIARGMSGAAIFRPQDARVIGIIHSNWEATTALGLPLIRGMVDGWLARGDWSVAHVGPNDADDIEIRST